MNGASVIAGEPAGPVPRPGIIGDVVQQRLPSLLDPPIAFAHRGARAHAPENTLDAFELALRLGATGLESDVWLTADGVPVLDHDGVVRVGRREAPDRDLQPRRAAGVTSRRSPSCSSACGSGLPPVARPQGPAVGPAVIDVGRASARRDLVAPTLAVPPRPGDRCWPLRAADADVRLVDSTRLDADQRRARAAGRDAGRTTASTRINMHHRRLERRPGRAVPPVRPLCASAGTCSSSTCSTTACGWASTASTATGSTA